jgi:VanZ family protein
MEKSGFIRFIVISGLLFFLLIFVVSFHCMGQEIIDTTKTGRNNHSKRMKIVLFSESTFILSSYVAFNYLWYKDYERDGFHFFNDGREWYGIDKAGHICGAYWLSNVNAKAYRWTGLEQKKSVIAGSLVAFLYMSSIEIFDGYSKAWGASSWDIAANAAGTGMFLAQELIWEQQLVLVKYSYFPSDYSKYRPELLGNNLGEKLLKDYNATTFWLSVNLKAISNTRVPDWLNLAFGYGATGMTGGFENYYSPLCHCKPVPDSERAREFYLSLDLDLSKIRLRNPFAKKLLFALNCIKIPAPALKYSKKKFQLTIR